MGPKRRKRREQTGSVPDLFIPLNILLLCILYWAFSGGLFILARRLAISLYGYVIIYKSLAEHSSAVVNTRRLALSHLDQRGMGDVSADGLQLDTLDWELDEA